MVQCDVTVAAVDRNFCGDSVS